MSDLISQDQSHPVQPQTEQAQTIEKTQNQCQVILQEAPKASIIKKFSLPSFDISKVILLFWQYGIIIAVSLVVVGIAYFLFTFQRSMKRESKVIGNIIEETLKESLKKNLDSMDAGKDIDKTAKQGKINENILSKQKEDTKAADNSKYIIEANRLYEQENYENAAAFYEKGLDKSMPFLNEDFAMYRLGDCYLKSDKYEEALKVFQTLKNDYINSPYQLKTRLKMGECYAGIGEFQKARKTLYSVILQEGKCLTDDDKSAVVDSYFKIADYYMEEAQRLHKATDLGTSSTVLSLASK